MINKNLVRFYNLLTILIFILIIFSSINTNSQLIENIKNYEADFSINTSLGENTEISEIKENITGLVHALVLENLSLDYRGYFRPNEFQSTINSSNQFLDYLMHSSTRFSSYVDYLETIVEHQIYETYKDNNQILLIYPEDWIITETTIQLITTPNSLDIHLISSKNIANDTTVLFTPIVRGLEEILFLHSADFQLSIDIPSSKFTDKTITETEDYLIQMMSSIEEILVLNLFVNEHTSLHSESLDYLRQKLQDFSEKNILSMIPFLPVLQIMILMYIILIFQRFYTDREARKILWEKGATRNQILKFTLKSNFSAQLISTLFLVILLIIILLGWGIPMNTIFSTALLLLFITIAFNILYLSINYFGILLDDLKISITRDIPSFSSKKIAFILALGLLSTIILESILTLFPRSFSIVLLYIDSDFISDIRNAFILIVIIFLLIQKEKIITRFFKPAQTPKDIWIYHFKKNKKINILIPIILILLTTSLFSLVITNENQEYESYQIEETYLFADKTYQYIYLPSEIVQMVEYHPLVADFGLIHFFSHDKLLGLNNLPMDITFLYNIDFLVDNYGFPDDQFASADKSILKSLESKNSIIIDNDLPIDVNDNSLMLQKYSATSDSYVQEKFDIVGYSNYRMSRSNTPSIYVSNETINIDDITEKGVGNLYVNFVVSATDDEIADFHNYLKSIASNFQGTIKEMNDIIIPPENNSNEILEIEIIIISILLPITILGLFKIDKELDRNELKLKWEKGVNREVLRSNLTRYIIIVSCYDIVVISLLAMIIFLIIRDMGTNFENMFPLLGLDVFMGKFAFYVLIPLIVTMSTIIYSYNKLVKEVVN